MRNKVLIIQKLKTRLHSEVFCYLSKARKHSKDKGLLFGHNLCHYTVHVLYDGRILVLAWGCRELGILDQGHLTESRSEFPAPKVSMRGTCIWWKDNF